MKALILAGGKGTRLRPITFSMAKQLVPVANKPVIEYGIESIVQAGITDFGIIVGDTAKEVEAALGDGSRWGARFSYIAQSEPLGLAHAVATARSYLGQEDFIMYLGDNLIKTDVAEFVREFQRHRPAATILLTPVPNPSAFGVAEMDGDRVVRLEEKPKNPKSNLALVGVYLFDHRIHESIEGLQPSWRGEYEITDAIQGLIERGLEVRSHVVRGWWKDTGTVEAMLEANRLLLEDLEPAVTGEVDAASRIEGRVSLGEGTTVESSTVRGPVAIGRNCRIQDSYIGPFTAIADNTQVIGTEIENSIVLQDSKLFRVPSRIEGSLLGRGVSVSSEGRVPRSLRIVMGDSSSLSLP